MESTIAGRLLYATRKEKHISQKELCRGLCNQSTLARIESGEIMPSLKQMEFFFTRLGKTVPDNILMLSKADKKRYDLENKLCNEMHDDRDSERLALLQEYKACHHSWGKLYEQFYLHQQGVYLSQFDERLQEALFVYEKALRLTVPEFSLAQENPTCLLSIQEVILLNAVAHSEYYLYDIEKKEHGLKNRAIGRMRFLKNYFEKHFENYKAWNMYSVILFNLTNWVGLGGNMKEARELAELGLEIERSRLHLFSFHLYNIGYSFAVSGEKEKGTRLLTRALTLEKLFDSYGDVEKAIEELKDTLNIDISIN